MSNIQEKQGGCICGAVRFTATDIEPAYHACHCAMCRRWGSAPFFGTTVGSIAFEDEAGVGLRTHSGRTWGLAGETPEVAVTDQRGGYNVLSTVSADP